MHLFGRRLRYVNFRIVAPAWMHLEGPRPFPFYGASQTVRRAALHRHDVPCPVRGLRSEWDSIPRVARLFSLRAAIRSCHPRGVEPPAVGDGTVGELWLGTVLQVTATAARTRRKPER